MRKLIILFFLIKSISNLTNAQTKIAEFSAPGNFEKKDYTVCYYDSLNYEYNLISQSDRTLTRLLLDSSFLRKKEYSYTSSFLSIIKDKEKFAGFITPLLLEKGSFEVFANKDSIFIIKPNFHLGIDSVFFSHPIKYSVQDESLISIIPGEKYLSILTISKSERKFYLYNINSDKVLEIKHFLLPESNFGDKENKMFAKDAIKLLKINFNTSFKYLIPVNVNESYFINSKLDPVLYYSSTAISFPIWMPYDVGICIVNLNLQTQNANVLNFFLNELSYNLNASVLYNYKSLATVIFDSTFVIKNASSKYFSYHFYNLNDGSEIKKFEADNKKEMDKLIHSDFNQQGTWLSKKQSKELKNSKNYVRKSFGSRTFVSGKNPDSITFTNLAYRYTPGIEGTFLEFSTSLVGYAANIHIGRLQIIPYLSSERDKLIYSHSKFSIKTLEPSKGKNVKTFLNNLLDDIDLKEISANSTFLLKKGQSYLLGVFDSKNQKFLVSSYHE